MIVATCFLEKEVLQHVTWRYRVRRSHGRRRRRWRWNDWGCHWRDRWRNERLVAQEQRSIAQEIGCWIAEIVRQIAFRRRPEIARWQFSQKDVRPFPRWRAQGVQQRRFAEIVGWQRAEQEIVGRPFAQRRQQEAVSLVNVRGRIHLRLRRDYILLRLICIRSEPAARPHHGRYRGVCPVSDVEALSTLVTGLDGDLRCDPVATRQLECLARRAHDSSAHEDGR